MLIFFLCPGLGWEGLIFISIQLSEMHGRLRFKLSNFELRAQVRIQPTALITLRLTVEGYCSQYETLLPIYFGMAKTFSAIFDWGFCLISTKLPKTWKKNNIIKKSWKWTFMEELQSVWISQKFMLLLVSCKTNIDWNRL